MSKVTEFIWKIWLRLNFLTQDVDNDYTGEVSTIGHTLHNEDIATRIVKERSELRYETILAILNERDSIVLDTVLAGSSVQDGVVHIAPSVTGLWIGSDRTVDPTRQKPAISISPTAELREGLTKVKLEILGVKDSGAYIGLVTDAATKAIDGHITPNGILVITGDKLRIAPEDNPEMGIFFVNEYGDKTPVVQISQNEPKKLTVLAPPLPPGNYTLQIVTRFSNGSTLLKVARTIIYDMPIIVE
ncbi:MAG: DUF4469 domain-containing protein [Dysgonamonadaceae bacterium]|jgi:hypothetical protein|nr:DUF4469 domain-containing protein [Dysgonamonadaceae bacterium]